MHTIACTVYQTTQFKRGEYLNDCTFKRITKKKAGYTQDELAKEIGISKRTLAYWEKGENNIKPEKAEELAKMFNVSVPYLLGYDSVKNETDIKVAVLDETLKKLYVIKDNMILRESDEGPNLLDLGLGTAIVAIESFKKEIEDQKEEENQ
ncbi:putative transcriptional regulator [Streptococcus infantarius subsp. infantarius]|nr:putative transcriptional regulator [Streptococcus infantarius subsp. infantarius]MCO4575782.1 putative transcriptional regulator [Streptococcus infantarius subsp. infantarius]